MFQIMLDISWKFDWDRTQFDWVGDLVDVDGSRLETWRIGSSLYKFGSWLIICLFVCPFVRPLRFSNRSWLVQINLKLHQTFTFVKFGLRSCFKLFGTVHPPACTHSAWNRARHFCLLFYFFDILNPFLTENEKNGGHSSNRYRRGGSLSFCSLFSISVRKSSYFEIILEISWKFDWDRTWFDWGGD